MIPTKLWRKTHMDNLTRDRALGWQYAKLSGHKNEELVKELLETNSDFRQHLLTRIGCSEKEILKITISGLHETNILGVLGNRTKSKTDLKIYFKDGKFVNISIKKSISGQVYLIGAEPFIKIFETHFNKIVPNNVKDAIKLFWAADPVNALKIINEFCDKKSEDFYLQTHHFSVNASTLKKYDQHLYDSMLNWFIDNIQSIAKLCFSMGAVEDKTEWSEFIWYINLLDEIDLDTIFSIDDICNAITNYANSETFYSSKNGGTTIQLPFGFVQWHQKQMQFHHMYSKLIKLSPHN